MGPRALIVAVAGLLMFASPALGAGTVSINSMQGPDPTSVTVPVAVEGVTANPAINAAFTDTNKLSPANLTVTINWGDGLVSSNQSGPNFDSNLLVTQVGGPGGSVYTVTDSHAFLEEGVDTMTLTVTETASPSNTDAHNTPAQIDDAPLAAAPSTPTLITGTGSNAASALTSYQSAIGGVDNGTTQGEQGGGFRHVTWDGVALDGSDPGSTVIHQNHVVALPFNRMSGLGLTFGGPLAVANDSFASVNPSAAGLFPAFSAPNIAAPFNGHQLELNVVAPGSVPAQPQASRGLGVMFINVQQPGTTIDYYSGDTLLDEVPVPTNVASGRLTFAGDLFSAPVVTRVVITLGGAKIFSFDGSTTSAGPSNTALTNLVALDDVVLAEPAPQDANISTTAGVAFAGAVVRFTDSDQFGNAHDYQASINWGDGTRSPGTVAADGSGTFSVNGGHTYGQSGAYDVSVTVSDFGGASYTTRFVAQVVARATATSLSCAPGGVTIGRSTTCTATVSDTGAGTASAPSGTVSFSTGSGLGGFNGGSCTLGAAGGAAARCTVSYTPSKVGSGTHSLSASFGGDATHAASNGSATVAVLPVCTITARSTASGGRLKVRITCEQRSAVTIGGTVTVARKGRHSRRRLRIASRKLTVGRSRTVTLELPAPGALRAAVKHHEAISAELTIKAKSTTTSSATATIRSLKLR